jgi:putative transposase
MSDYRRLWITGGCYFFTVNLRERAPNDLLLRHVDVLRASVCEVRRSWPFRIDAWVVLPDHLHCLWTLPEGDADFATRWRLIKAGFAHRLPRTEWRSAVPPAAANAASGNGAIGNTRSVTIATSRATWTTCTSTR